MIIRITDKSEPKTINVDFGKNIFNMEACDIASKYNLVEEMVDYHYDVCQEYHNFVDICDAGADEVMQQIISEKSGLRCPQKVAENVMDEVRNEVIDIIIYLDNEKRAA